MSVPTAFAGIDYSVLDFWAGEVLDVPFDWSPRMRYSAGTSALYATTATGVSGSGWTGAGQTASSFTIYAPAGFSALLSATAQYWSSALTASAGGPTSAYASSLTALHSFARLSATGGAGSYLVSARMRTSSGVEFRAVVTARIQG